MTAPVVFISYSHDSEEHKSWVNDLASRLMNNGIDVILDQWDLGPGGDLPHFMESSITKASRVLMICTERYVEKANGGTGGVGYEKMIVTADLLKQIGSNRVIPILRNTTDLPTFLGSKLYIDLSKADYFETGVDHLLRELLNAPLFKKPPLGKAPTFLSQPKPKPTLPNPSNQFLLAAAKLYETSDSNGYLETTDVLRAMGTSKLLFDIAFDQAMKNDLVYATGNKQFVRILPEGRAAMLRLLSEQEDKS